MTLVKCNLCGADDFTVVFPKGVAQLHRIVRCNRCSLMYANPQELIDVESFDTVRKTEFDTDAGRQYLQKQHVQLPDNLQALKVINQMCPGKGRLLEIGSFAGVFLDRIRSSGWQVLGLDPDPGAAAYARQTYGLEVVNKILPDAKFPDAAFDAVVMLHVIEHVPDPSSCLAEVRRILKPGGAFVLETPRFDSLMFKLLGRRERSLSNCNGHIYFFTIPALVKMLQDDGFKVERVDKVGRTLTLDRLLSNVGVMSRSTRFKGFLNAISLKLGFDKIEMHVNARDMQRIYCRA